MIVRIEIINFEIVLNKYYLYIQKSSVIFFPKKKNGNINCTFTFVASDCLRATMLNNMRHLHDTFVRNIFLAMSYVTFIKKKIYFHTHKFSRYNRKYSLLAIQLL